MSSRAHLAAKAVDGLAQLLGHWPGKFGRAPGADERAGWTPEATRAVGTLLQIATEARARMALTAAMHSGHADVRRNSAVTLRWLCSTEPIELADAAVRAPALSDADLAVKKFAIAAIGPLAKGQLDTAKRLLLGTECGDAWPLIDELLDQVGPKDIPLASLSDVEVAALLQKVPALRSLGVTNNAHHVSLFLKDVALSRPAAFVDWTFAHLPSGPDVVWADVHLSLEELRRLIDPDDIETAERSRLVDALLDRLVSSGGLKSAGVQPLAVLLAWASSVDEVMPRVANLLSTADEAGFGRIVRGLVEFGEPLVFGRPAAMACLVDHAKRIGGRCEAFLRSVAFEAVGPGPVSVGDHPIPAYDRIAKQAAECGASTPNPALKELYRTLEATYGDMSMRHDEME